MADSDPTHQHLTELGAIVTVHEKTIESLERQVAALAMGFADQGVLIEGLIAQLGYSDAERQEHFKKYVEERRAEILKFLQEATDVLPGTTE